MAPIQSGLNIIKQVYWSCMDGKGCNFKSYFAKHLGSVSRSIVSANHWLRNLCVSMVVNLCVSMVVNAG